MELLAVDFNTITQYVLLLLAPAAFFAVGSRKKVDLFKLSMLIVASIVAFRTQRDAWFLGVCCVVFLADLEEKDVVSGPALKLPELAGVLAFVTLLVWLAARNIGFSTSELDRAISREYPVKAVNFVHQNSFPGPLYNNLDWGGFLIWYMPQYPVTVDGRNDLYGDQLDQLTYNSAQGESYTSDPYLNEAGLVLLPKKTPLSKFLTIDSRFRLVYEDAISVVFVRN